LGYIVADARPSPLGGGVSTDAAHHPVASTLGILFDVPRPSSFNSTSIKSKESTPVKLCIGEVLEVCDLQDFGSLFLKTVLTQSLYSYNTFSPSVSHISTSIRRRAETNRLSIMHTRLFSIFTNTGLVCGCRGFESAYLPHLRSLPSTTGNIKPLKIRNRPHLTILGPRGCMHLKTANISRRAHKQRSCFRGAYLVWKTPEEETREVK